MGNGALPNGLSYRAHPRLYLRDISLGCRIGLLSEQSGHGPTCCRLNSVGNDPERYFATVNFRVAKGKGWNLRGTRGGDRSLSAMRPQL